MNKMTDEEILMNYLSTKDEELFNILYKRMHKRLYALALRILRSPDDAEDVAQSVFLKLCDYKPESEIESAESFLYSMIRNQANDVYRSNHTGVRKDMVSIHDLDPETPEFAYLPAYLESPVDNVSLKEELNRVKLAMNDLPTEQKEAIEAYYAGQSIPQIAQSLGLPYPTVWNRIRRGMATLREKFDSKNKSMIIQQYGTCWAPVEYANAI